MHWRICRSLIWICALAGVAALAWRLEDTPADPAPRPGEPAALTAPSRRWVTRVFLQQGAGNVLREFRKSSLRSFREDAPGIVAYYDDAQRAGECQNFLEALRLAADHNLDDSVWFEEDSAYPVCVAPVGQIRPASLPEFVPRYVRGPIEMHRTPGAIWERAPKYPAKYLHTFVASYRRGTPGHVPGPLPKGLSAQYYPTHAIAPLSDAGYLKFCAEFVRESVKMEAHVVEDGLILVGSDGQHEAAQNLLDPVVFGSVLRDLTWGKDERRAAAARAALTGTNPFCAEFAFRAWGRGYAPQVLDQVPDWLLQKRDWPYEGTVRRLFDELPPEAVVSALHRVTQAREAPSSSVALRLALTSKAPTVRKLAMDLVLERLPRDVLGHFTDELSLASWPLADREEFFNRFVDRLRRELQTGDRAYATTLLNSALTGWEIMPQHGRAMSRLLEFGADLFMDPIHGWDFRRGSGGPVAARELLRDSRPEARQMACGFLTATATDRESWYVSVLLRPLAGDPYTEEFVRPVLGRKP